MSHTLESEVEDRVYDLKADTIDSDELNSLNLALNLSWRCEESLTVTGHQM